MKHTVHKNKKLWKKVTIIIWFACIWLDRHNVLFGKALCAAASCSLWWLVDGWWLLWSFLFLSFSSFQSYLSWIRVWVIAVTLPLLFHSSVLCRFVDVELNIDLYLLLSHLFVWLTEKLMYFPHTHIRPTTMSCNRSIAPFLFSFFI